MYGNHLQSVLKSKFSAIELDFYHKSTARPQSLKKHVNLAYHSRQPWSLTID